MSTLTLTLDDELIAQVEAYSRRTGTDLSTLFSEAIRPLVTPPQRTRRPLSAEVEALAGCITLPPDFDYKEFMAEELTKRYLATGE